MYHRLLHMRYRPRRRACDANDDRDDGSSSSRSSRRRRDDVRILARDILPPPQRYGRCKVSLVVSVLGNPAVIIALLTLTPGVVLRIRTASSTFFRSAATFDKLGMGCVEGYAGEVCVSRGLILDQQTHRGLTKGGDLSRGQECLFYTMIV